MIPASSLSYFIFDDYFYDGNGKVEVVSNPKYANIADELKKRLQNELEKDGDFRALGRDTSWLNKVPWTAAKEAGTWQKWLDNSVNK